MLHKLMDRSVDYSIAAERVYVDDPGRVRWMMAGDLAVGVAAILAMGVVGNVGGWLDTAARLYLGVYVGLRVLARMRRAMAYRNGWLDGRARMVNALGEAQRRGMSPADWLEGEYARDVAVLGSTLPPLHEDEDES